MQSMVAGLLAPKLHFLLQPFMLNRWCMYECIMMKGDDEHSLINTLADFWELKMTKEAPKQTNKQADKQTNKQASKHRTM